MTPRMSAPKGSPSSDPEQRRRAVQGLLEREAADRVPLVVRALADEDWRVRKEAIAVAAELGPTAELVAALLDALGTGDDVGLRNAAVEALAALGPASVAAMAGAIDSFDADARKLAAEALGRGHDAAALPVLARLVSDPDPNVRVTAVEQIAEIGAVALDAATRTLCDALGGDDVHVRLAALDGLNRLGVVVAWDDVAKLAEDPVLRRSVLVAAARSCDPRAAGALVRALDDARRSIFGLAVAGLAEIVLAGGAHVPSREHLRAVGGDARARLAALLTDAGQPELRRAALVVAAVLDERAAIAPALDALADERSSREAEAALRIFGERAAPALVERIRRGDERSRTAAIGLAATFAPRDGEAIVDALRDAASEPATDVASRALAALATLGDAHDLSLLASLVASPEPRTSASAEIALASLVARHQTDAAALARRLSTRRSTRAAAAVIVGAIDATALGTVEGDVAFLTGLLSDPDAHVRRAAVVALGERGVASSLDALSSALSDEAPDVKLAAVRALGRLRAHDDEPIGTAHLLDVVRGRGDVELVGAAIRALGESGDVGVLAPLVRSVSPAVAVAAVDALGGSDDPARLSPLLEAAASADANVVKAALLALEPLADPEVVARFGAALDHEAWDVRRLAADCLGRARDGAAAELLRARLAREHEPLVREAIDRALLVLAAGSTLRRPITIAPPSGS